LPTCPGDEHICPGRAGATAKDGSPSSPRHRGKPKTQPPNTVERGQAGPSTSAGEIWRALLIIAVRRTVSAGPVGVNSQRPPWRTHRQREGIVRSRSVPAVHEEGPRTEASIPAPDPVLSSSPSHVHDGARSQPGCANVPRSSSAGGDKDPPQRYGASRSLYPSGMVHGRSKEGRCPTGKPRQRATTHVEGPVGEVGCPPIARAAFGQHAICFTRSVRPSRSDISGVAALWTTAAAPEIQMRPQHHRENRRTQKNGIGE